MEQKKKDIERQEHKKKAKRVEEKLGDYSRCFEAFIGGAVDKSSSFSATEPPVGEEGREKRQKAEDHSRCYVDAYKSSSFSVTEPLVGEEGCC
jgi:hypothetical protein